MGYTSYEAMTSGGYRIRPAELYRADLISAMKLPDSYPMELGSFLTIREPWRSEWDSGVQVCVSPDQLPECKVRTVGDFPHHEERFGMPDSRLTEEENSEPYVQYDIDDLDINWLESLNQKRKFRALAPSDGLSKEMLKEAIIILETNCQKNMAHAVTTEETLGIEYDDSTACDVCRDCESEESNEMVYCDSCNVCVHQACYGIISIPKGQWLCKPCAARESTPKCVLCSNSRGALKRVRPGNMNWAHLSCALWIPEVRVGNVERMEPIMNIEAIPISRWNLVCSLCRKREGVCVQCSHPSCATAHHVTCAFNNGLEMKSRIDVSNNGVLHESYCPKHTALRRSSRSSPNKKGDVNQPNQLLRIEKEFYKYASPDDLVKQQSLSPKLSTLLYNYWKLKRSSQHNRPLLTDLPLQNSLATMASLRPELAVGLENDEVFQKIINLRQNLEKARNLVYMVQKREKTKNRLVQCQLEIEELRHSLPLEPEVVEDKTVQEEQQQQQQQQQEEEEEEEEEEEKPTVRQTRSMVKLADPPDSTATTPAVLAAAAGDLASVSTTSSNGPVNGTTHLLATAASGSTSQQQQQQQQQHTSAGGSPLLPLSPPPPLPLPSSTKHHHHKNLRGLGSPKSPPASGSSSSSSSSRLKPPPHSISTTTTTTAAASSSVNTSASCSSSSSSSAKQPQPFHSIDENALVRSKRSRRRVGSDGGGGGNGSCDNARTSGVRVGVGVGGVVASCGSSSSSHDDDMHLSRAGGVNSGHAHSGGGHAHSGGGHTHSLRYHPYSKHMKL